MRVSNERSYSSGAATLCGSEKPPQPQPVPNPRGQNRWSSASISLFLGALKANIQTILSKGRNHTVLYRKPFICVCCDKGGRSRWAASGEGEPWWGFPTGSRVGGKSCAAPFLDYPPPSDLPKFITKFVTINSLEILPRLERTRLGPGSRVGPSVLAQMLLRQQETEKTLFNSSCQSIRNWKRRKKWRW